MENASKALIIAGAILLSILLISLGIMIFNQAQDTVNNSGMTQAEMQSFNNKFLKYEGTEQKGSVAKSLVNEVIANNADETTPPITVKLTANSATTTIVAPASGSTAATNSTSGILTNKTYEIKITSYANGYVSEITLTQK